MVHSWVMGIISKTIAVRWGKISKLTESDMLFKMDLKCDY